MRNKIVMSALVALGWAGSVSLANAQEREAPWILRLGVANIQNQDDLDLSVGGAPVPGAALHFHPVYTPMAEIGYHFTEDLAAVATVGFPPATSAYGGGSIAGYGKLQSFTYGPTALTLQYQPFHSDWFRPYIGAGMSYMIIFSTHAATVQNPGLTNDLAPVVEAGADFAFDDQYGLFVEAKKAFLNSDASGTIGGFPLTGTAHIAPWVFSLGISARF
jgi:outer membrane protein